MVNGSTMSYEEAEKRKNRLKIYFHKTLVLDGKKTTISEIIAHTRIYPAPYQTLKAQLFSAQDIWKGRYGEVLYARQGDEVYILNTPL